MAKKVFFPRHPHVLKSSAKAKPRRVRPRLSRERKEVLNLRRRLRLVRSRLRDTERQLDRLIRGLK